jgi:hypothetical protein
LSDSTPFPTFPQGGRSKEKKMVYSRIINESKQNLGASQNIKTKAKGLLKQMTDTEKILWNYLRKRNNRGFIFEDNILIIYIFWTSIL